MSKRFVKCTPSEFASGTGKDFVTLADGLIVIRVVQARKGSVRLLITAPEDIDIKRGDSVVVSKETSNG